jgi:hypothetical protein
LITLIISDDEQHRSWSFSLRSCLHSRVISSLLGPNIFVYTEFWHTNSVRSLLNVA